MKKLPTKLSGLKEAGEAFGRLKNSLKIFGDLGGIVYNKRTRAKRSFEKD